MLVVINVGTFFNQWIQFVNIDYYITSEGSQTKGRKGAAANDMVFAIQRHKNIDEDVVWEIYEMHSLQCTG
jgi:hypothetical protein